MKKAIAILTVLLLFGMHSCNPEDFEHVKQGPRIISSYPYIESFDFEGHHYVVVYSGEGCGIIHAPNCPCQKEDCYDRR